MITITAVDVRLYDGDQVRGYVTLTIDDSFVVRGIKLIQGSHGRLFTAMPSRRRPDGSYQDIAHPISPEARLAIERAVQREYLKAVASEGDRANSITNVNPQGNGKGRRMARRYSGNMSGEQYLGNHDKAEVHDLENEDTAANGCQIDEIIRAGHDRPFHKLTTAHGAGYDNCAKCLGGSRR